MTTTSHSTIRTARRGEAGFTIVEGVIAALLLCVMMIGAGALFGGEASKALLAQRQRVGREWADSGLAEIASRARRAPSGRPRTEAPLWTQLTGYEDLGAGNLRKTAATAWNTSYTLTLQQILATDSYVEFTPPPNGVSVALFGSDGSNFNLVIGTGNPSVGVWMGIYENGVIVTDTCCEPYVIPAHLGGDRYRIEMADKVRYWRIRGQTRTIIYESKNPLPGYPVTGYFNNLIQNDKIQDAVMHGVLSDPLALPDGGSITPGGPCGAPFCDYVWMQPRQGGTVSAPFALAPDAAPPQGSLLLFVRRFKIETSQSSWGLRKVTMTLADATDSQPFITNSTEVNSNPTAP